MMRRKYGRKEITGPVKVHAEGGKNKSEIFYGY
jgi:hypothetical protein